MSDETVTVEEFAQRVLRGVKGFSADMKRQQIHVGLEVDGAVRCVACGEMWPCGGAFVTADLPAPTGQDGRCFATDGGIVLGDPAMSDEARAAVDQVMSAARSAASVSATPIRKGSAKGQPPAREFMRRCVRCSADFVGLAFAKPKERGLWDEWSWFCSTECWNEVHELGVTSLRPSCR